MSAIYGLCSRWGPDGIADGTLLSFNSHLAEKWESQYLEPAHPLVVRRMSPNPTVLATIDHLVLFDLLGASNPRILNTYQETAWLFDMMKDADSRLREANLVQNDGEEWFQKSTRGFRIEDDHVPVGFDRVSPLKQKE